MGYYTEVGFVDDAAREMAAEFCGCRIFGSIDEAVAGAHGEGAFLIAIGRNQVRARCFDLATTLGLRPAILVHPSATVSPAAMLGGGTVVMPGAVINAGAVVGRDCIVNTSAVIEHDSVIGDHAHISPGALLGGGVRVGPYAHIGIGAIALPEAEVGEGATIGAGAVVLRRIPAWATAVGIPAKVL
jgi:acetyltransferase EpsM